MRFLFSPKTSTLALGPTQPPIQWVPRFCHEGVKWPGYKADHSPPSGTKVMKSWSYIYISLIRLHSVDKKHLYKDRVIFRKWTGLLVVGEAQLWNALLGLHPSTGLKQWGSWRYLYWKNSDAWIIGMRVSGHRLIRTSITVGCSLCGSTENNSPLIHHANWLKLMGSTLTAIVNVR